MISVVIKFRHKYLLLCVGGTCLKIITCCQEWMEIIKRYEKLINAICPMIWFDYIEICIKYNNENYKFPMYYVTWHKKELIEFLNFRGLLLGHFVQCNAFFILLSWAPTYFHENYPDAKVCYVTMEIYMWLCVLL